MLFPWMYGIKIYGSMKNDGNGTSASDVVSIPPITQLGTSINSQVPILFTTFCVDNSTELWIFQLKSSPLTDAPVVSGAGIINDSTCESQLQTDKDNALQSYCSCLSYKEENCPDMTEVDIHGCP